MQNLISSKTPAEPEQSECGTQRVSLAPPKLNTRVRALDPLPVVFMQVNRNSAECLAPFDHRRVVMRMRDRYGGNAAQGLNEGDRIGVDQADTVPQDITRASLNQKRALTDPEL